MKKNTKSSARRGILAGGNWLIDRVKLIDSWPAQDTLATITAQSASNGGGPYNLLKDLAKMKCGFPLAGVGLIGNDADGETILQDCDAHGIDRRGLEQTEAAATSYTDVMTVSGTGRRTFFHQHGANAKLAARHFPLAQSSARIFYLGYMCLLRTLDVVDGRGQTPAARLFKQASSQGFVTVADLVSSESSDFPAVINPSLPHLDYLLLNEYELARLVGEEASKEPATLVAQARTILARGVRKAVVVHLPEGALCVCPGEVVVTQPSVRVPPALVAGTVGAGDAFAAGFLLGVHEGWEFQAGLELGVCVAAASLRHAASSEAVQPWKKCLAWGRKLGFHEPLTI